MMCTGAEHSAIFPLFFGVAPSDEVRRALVAQIAAKRMRVSVYAAYFMLHGLYLKHIPDIVVDSVHRP